MRLKVALADTALEADFFRGALQRIEDRRRNSKSNGGPTPTAISHLGVVIALSAGPVVVL